VRGGEGIDRVCERGMDTVLQPYGSQSARGDGLALRRVPCQRPHVARKVCIHPAASSWGHAYAAVVAAIAGADAAVVALQRFFGVSWDDTDGEGRVATPTLMPLALRPHSIPLAVLAIGSEAGFVISEHGNELASFHVAFPPVAPAVVADFDGDGLNDIIVVTRGGVFGYSQVQHLGGMSFGALLLTLIVAMGIVWYSQQYDSGLVGAAASAVPGMMGSGLGIGGLAGGQGQTARARKLRSTEYVD